jgi:hypothetical protein
MILFYIFFGGVLFLIYTTLINKNKQTKNHTILCDKKTLCNSIVLWGINNIPPVSLKQNVTVKISNYKHKGTMAVFYPESKEIKIYIRNHHTVVDIVDSLLHEVIHYKQFTINPRWWYRKYSKLIKLIGYHDHPMEKEAEELSKKYQIKCVNYLIKNGLIR